MLFMGIFGSSQRWVLSTTHPYSGKLVSRKANKLSQREPTLFCMPRSTPIQVEKGLALFVTILVICKATKLQNSLKEFREGLEFIATVSKFNFSICLNLPFPFPSRVNFLQE